MSERVRALDMYANLRAQGFGPKQFERLCRDLAGGAAKFDEHGRLGPGPRFPEQYPIESEPS